MKKGYQESEEEGSESEESGSGSGSGSEGESEFEDDYGNEHERDCEITDDLIMPKLSVSCLYQHLPNGKKCFKNKCLEVTKLISISEETSAYGNIVQVKNDDEDDTYIVKWNRYRNDVDEFKYEVRLQRAASTLGIAPRILQVYEQKSEKSRGGYIYIFMDDLIRMGYKTIFEYFGVFKKGKQVGWKKYENEKYDLPELAIVEIAKTLKKLHSTGIVHGDLHPGNVFTNGRHVMLIDFGNSKRYANPGDAWRNEKFATTRRFWSDVYTHEMIIPNNWKQIKILSKPYK